MARTAGVIGTRRRSKTHPALPFEDVQTLYGVLRGESSGWLWAILEPEENSVLVDTLQGLSLRKIGKARGMHWVKVGDIRILAERRLWDYYRQQTRKREA